MIDSSPLLTYNVTIPKQTKRTALTESAESVAEITTSTLKGMMSISFVFNAMFAVMLSKMFIWVNCLQIIFMLPLNNIRLPPLASTLASTMISICEFDFFPPEMTTDHIFSYEEDLSQDV